MNLIIDIGNTNTKLAVFEQNKLLETRRCSVEKLPAEVGKICIQFSKIEQLLVSSVIEFSDRLFSELSQYGMPYCDNSEKSLSENSITDETNNCSIFENCIQILPTSAGNFSTLQRLVSRSLFCSKTASLVFVFPISIIRFISSFRV